MVLTRGLHLQLRRGVELVQDGIPVREARAVAGPLERSPDPVHHRVRCRARGSAIGSYVENVWGRRPVSHAVRCSSQQAGSATGSSPAARRVCPARTETASEANQSANDVSPVAKMSATDRSPTSAGGKASSPTAASRESTWVSCWVLHCPAHSPLTVSSMIQADPTESWPQA